MQQNLKFKRNRKLKCTYIVIGKGQFLYACGGGHTHTTRGHSSQSIQKCSIAIVALCSVLQLMMRVNTCG